MRNELELLELIDRYLNGELTEKETADFEARMKTDTQLAKEVEIQKELLKGIDNFSLRQSAKRAYKKYKLTKAAWVAGIGLAVLIAVASAVYLYNETYNKDAYHLPEYNENGEKIWSDADKYLPHQKFTINTAKDTVIETQGGVVIAIPANAFTDESGHEVLGKVEFEVKEALDPNVIINAGLSTMSNDRLLQTGGMFYLNARLDGKSLQMNKDIYVEVPTDTIIPEMQLFTGERRDDGSINWVDPKSLADYLTTVDIHSLNFYPPNFEWALSEAGYPNLTKAAKDSIFYSFYCGEQKMKVMGPTDDDYVLRAIGTVPDSLSEQQAIAKGLVEYDTIRFKNGVPYFSSRVHINTTTEAYYPTEETAVSSSCGIQPSQIQAIWNDKFQNTILATKEFEERLQVLYSICQGGLLDLYVNNLDLPMWQIDSMSAMLCSGIYKDKFLEFAARHNGAVKDGDKLAAKLSEYYQRKQMVFEEAARKTQEDFWKKQAELDHVANKKSVDHSNEEALRNSLNFQKEFEINYMEACGQLGYDCTINRTPVNRIRATVNTPGWKNLDQYVREATANRETLDYTDPNTGKKARIEYLPLTVKVDNAGQYDRIYTYLVTKELYSFQRMKQDGNSFNEKLNELFEYQLVCVAYKGEQAYYHISDEPITTGDMDIQLEQISKIDLEKALNQLKSSKKGNDVLKDLEYQTFKMLDDQRRSKNIEIREFRAAMYRVVFPCPGDVEEAWAN